MLRKQTWAERDIVAPVVGTAGAALIVWALALRVSLHPALVIGAAAAGALVSYGLATAVTAWCGRSAIDFAPSQRSAIAAILTAAAWGGAVFLAGSEPYLPTWLYLSAIAVWLALVDQRTHRIPSAATYWAAAGTGVFVLVAGLVGDDLAAMWRSFGGGAATFGFLLVLAVATRGGVGLGDVRLSLSLGMVLGYLSWTAVSAAIVVAFLLMFPTALVTLLYSRITGRRTAAAGVAAGPYLVAACILVLGVGTL